MKPESYLDYFVGKVCTVFTGPINHNLAQDNPQGHLDQMLAYWLGRVDAVTENGIVLSQLGTGQKSFWFYQGIRGIAEEKVLDSKKDAGEIGRLAALTKPKMDRQAFVEPERMAELARQAQKPKS